MNVDERIKGIKVWVPDQKISRHVQEKLFELGGHWNNSKNICEEEFSFIFVDKYGDLSYIYKGKRYYDNHKNKEVYYQDLLEWEPREEQEEQLHYSKWIGRNGKKIAIKGDNLLKVYSDGGFMYDLTDNPNYLGDKVSYEVVTAEELKKGDVCIQDDIKYEDTEICDFWVFMGRDEDNCDVFNFLKNIDGVERLRETYQFHQKFKRFLRE